MPYRLGKKAPRLDARTLKLASYTAALPPPPPSCDLTDKITHLGIMLNDTLGDCTCAAAGHVIQAWTAEDGTEVILPDASILAAYEGACGYVPGDPSTDQGGAELDVLNYWRKTGIGGHTITAYASLEKKDTGGGIFTHHSSWKHSVMNAVYYFGAAYIGVALPDAALPGDSVPEWVLPTLHGRAWRPNPNNGHAVCIVSYDADGGYVITWGQLLRFSWDFLDLCMDEGYCPLANDIVGPDGKSPEGFALTELQADLNEVTA